MTHDPDTTIARLRSEVHDRGLSALGRYINSDASSQERQQAGGAAGAYVDVLGLIHHLTGPHGDDRPALIEMARQLGDDEPDDTDGETPRWLMWEDQ